MSRRAWVEQVMGMPVSIHVRGPEPGTSRVLEAVEAAFGRLEEADALFSTYRADSEVTRLRRGQLTTRRAHPLVREVLDLCREATHLTEGAFTATLPDELGHPRWDPTGLVKGWACERAAAVLAKVPGHTFCLNAGGDVVVGGDLGDDPGAARTADGGDAPDAAGARDAPAWRVGVEDPRDRSRVAEVVALRRGGVATSGNAARGAHLYDPLSRRFVDRAGSVTVVGPSLTWADVWATALFVGGRAAADRFAVAAGGYRVIVL